MQTSIFQQGLDLMIFGMGTVFVFLSVLVLVTMAMSALVQSIFPEPGSVATSSAEADGALQGAQQSGQQNPVLLAVIKEAIHLHRSTSSATKSEANK